MTPQAGSGRHSLKVPGRVEELVLREALPAQRIGSQWVISAEGLRSFEHNRWSEAGRPLSQDSAWRMIHSLEREHIQIASNQLDRQRRRLRSRAQHLEAYVHPGVLLRIRRHKRAVLGGRDAAREMSAPVDLLESIDIYLLRSDFAEMLSDYGVHIDEEVSNAHLHVIEDETWPFVQGQQFVSRWVCWLDLADAQDRASMVVLDRQWARPSHV